MNTAGTTEAQRTDDLDSPEVPEAVLRRPLQARGQFWLVKHGLVADRAEADALARQREVDLRADLPELRDMPVDVKQLVYRAYAYGWRAAQRRARSASHSEPSSSGPSCH